MFLSLYIAFSRREQSQKHIFCDDFLIKLFKNCLKYHFIIQSSDFIILSRYAKLCKCFFAFFMVLRGRKYAKTTADGKEPVLPVFLLHSERLCRLLTKNQKKIIIIKMTDTSDLSIRITYFNIAGMAKTDILRESEWRQKWQHQRKQSG